MADSQEARPEQCTAITDRTGERCKYNTIAGTEYCSTHLDFTALAEGEVRQKEFSQSDGTTSTTAEPDTEADDSTTTQADAAGEEPEPVDDDDPRDRLPEPEPASQSARVTQSILEGYLREIADRFRGAGVPVRNIAAIPAESRIRLETRASDAGELGDLVGTILRGWWSVVNTYGFEWAADLETVATVDGETAPDEIAFSIARGWLPDDAADVRRWNALHDQVEADLREATTHTPDIEHTPLFQVDTE